MATDYYYYYDCSCAVVFCFLCNKDYYATRPELRFAIRHNTARSACKLRVFSFLLSILICRTSRDTSLCKRLALAHIAAACAISSRACGLGSASTACGLMRKSCGIVRL
jgi:hypothetical protein